MSLNLTHGILRMLLSKMRLQKIEMQGSGVEFAGPCSLIHLSCLHWTRHAEDPFYREDRGWILKLDQALNVNV